MHVRLPWVYITQISRLYFSFKVGNLHIYLCQFKIIKVYVRRQWVIHRLSFSFLLLCLVVLHLDSSHVYHPHLSFLDLNNFQPSCPGWNTKISITAKLLTIPNAILVLSTYTTIFVVPFNFLLSSKIISHRCFRSLLLLFFSYLSAMTSFSSNIFKNRNLLVYLIKLFIDKTFIYKLSLINLNVKHFFRRVYEAIYEGWGELAEANQERVKGPGILRMSKSQFLTPCQKDGLVGEKVVGTNYVPQV